MRLNLKVVLVFLCVVVFFVTITFWSQCGELSLAPGFLHKWDRRIYGGKNDTAHCSNFTNLQMKKKMICSYFVQPKTHNPSRISIVLSIRSTRCHVCTRVTKYLCHFHFCTTISRCTVRWAAPSTVPNDSTGRTAMPKLSTQRAAMIRREYSCTLKIIMLRLVDMDWYGLALNDIFEFVPLLICFNSVYVYPPIDARSCEMHQRIGGCASVDAMGGPRLLLSHTNCSIRTVTLQQEFNGSGTKAKGNFISH